MESWLRPRLLGFFVVLFGCGAVSFAAETLTTLDLIAADAALCLEIPRPEQSWKAFETSPLMGRLRAFPGFERLFDGQSFQQWQSMEDHVARLTGQKLSTQLRALFAKSLVVAIYVPANGKPQGILIGEATSSAAVEMAVSTWNKMEPNEVTTVKTYRGHRYHQRKKHANAEGSTVFVTLDRWFAISDQDSLIQDVIDRFTTTTSTTTATTASRTPPMSSLRESPLFQQNRNRLKPNAAAYLHISARPWDRGLEESSRNDRDPVNPAMIWKHVTAVSAGLHIDQGLVCEAVVELDTSHLPGGWSQFVSTGAEDSHWSRRIPTDALLAVSGHLEISPLLNFLISQMPSRDRTEFARIRRVAQSVTGGHDVIDVVLPSIARDFTGCIVTRTDERTKRVVMDGSLGFILKSPTETGLLTNVARGLETAISMLAVYFSTDGDNAVTVKHEQTDAAILSYLSESAPFPVAYGVNEKQQQIVVAGSPARLRSMLNLPDSTNTQSRLMQHAEHYFPNANQLVWFDAARVRETLEQSGNDLANLFSHGSTQEASRIASRFGQARQLLAVVDSLFVAGRIESDHVRVIFGGGLDVK